jgi:hypothetical protein
MSRHSLFRFWLLASLVINAEATKHPRTPEQEQAARAQAAQELVASLLKERNGDSSAQFSSNGIMAWLPTAYTGDFQEEDVREIQAEFEQVLGKDLIDAFEHDLESIKKELQPTFLAIPRNDNGEVGYTGVRYALHRLFVSRHGWYIHGIDPEGGNYNESSPSDILKGHIPDHVQQLIDKLLYGRGFGLAEVALLGAILENLIHQEAIDRLGSVYKTFDVSLEKTLSSADIDHSVDLYMSAYIMGLDVTKISKQELQTNYDHMNEAYPGWEETRQFTRKIRAEKLGDADVSFKQAVAVVADITEKHGSWQQKECLDFKQRLMNLEDQKDGCVPVSNFYKGMREQGKWQFSESPGYLRGLGALDDSDPENLRVMIPNYLDGASNCVASSSYYSVCCINEGEGLLLSIEQQIQAPDAEPGYLASIVAGLPSSTMPAGRTLPPSLLQHLEEIAKVHDGRVPLHSRLFMQWMHNAYPHECPYPHPAGRTSPRLPEVWMAEQHKDPTVSRSEMNSFAMQAQGGGLHKSGQCGQWLDHEELYVPWHKRASEREAENEAHAWFGAYGAAILAAVASMTLLIVTTAKSIAKSVKPTKMIVT